MSLFLNGICLLKSDSTVYDVIDLSFDLTRVACDLKIGVKLGGNANQSYFEKKENSSKGIILEITDNPLTPNAERLLNGDGVIVCIGSVEYHPEPLKERIDKLQKFFQTMLNSRIVENIEIYYYMEDFESTGATAIQINDFAQFMLKAYDENDNWTPSLHMIIKN